MSCLELHIYIVYGVQYMQCVSANSKYCLTLLQGRILMFAKKSIAALAVSAVLVSSVALAVPAHAQDPTTDNALSKDNLTALAGLGLSLDEIKELAQKNGKTLNADQEKIVNDTIAIISKAQKKAFDQVVDKAEEVKKDNTASEQDKEDAEKVLKLKEELGSQDFDKLSAQERRKLASGAISSHVKTGNTATNNNNNSDNQTNTDPKPKDSNDKGDNKGSNKPNDDGSMNNKGTHKELPQTGDANIAGLLTSLATVAFGAAGALSFKRRHYTSSLICLLVRASRIYYKSTLKLIKKPCI